MCRFFIYLLQYSQTKFLILLLRINSYFWRLIKLNVKKIITFLFLTAPIAVYAQPKVLTQATITTKTNIVAPEGDEPVQSTTTSDGGEVRVMRFGGDGETKTTTWLKNDLTKIFSES